MTYVHPRLGYEGVSNGELDQFGHAVDTQFPLQVRPVRVGGLVGNPQAIGDLLTFIPLGKQLQHFTLPKRQ